MPLLSISPTLPFITKILQQSGGYEAKKKERYRYRIGDIRFVYQVDRDNRLIRIVQIDNRGDIY